MKLADTVSSPGIDYWNSVSLSRTSAPSASFLTISRWSERVAGFHVVGDAECGLRMVTLARARCSTLAGGGAVAAESMASRRSMSPTLPPQAFGDLSHWFNLNALARSFALARDFGSQLEQQAHRVVGCAQLRDFILRQIIFPELGLFPRFEAFLGAGTGSFVHGLLQQSDRGQARVRVACRAYKEPGGPFIKMIHSRPRTCGRTERSLLGGAL